MAEAARQDEINKVKALEAKELPRKSPKARPLSRDEIHQKVKKIDFTDI